MSGQGFPVAEVTVQLDKNGKVIEKWEALFDKLVQEEAGEKLQLGNAYRTRTITSYELISRILNLWVSQKSKEANIRRLIEILDTLGFHVSAGSLQETYYPEEVKVETTPADGVEAME